MEVAKLIDRKFWNNKKVFVTGHTGFKGGWLCLWLQQMGAKVKGFSLEPFTEPNIFSEANVSRGMESELGDICDYTSLLNSLDNFKPEIVIHMAAQSLVRFSYENPVLTYNTNVMGTVHLLEAIRKVNSTKAVVNVTSDKCYENKEWPWAYRENDVIGGYDPYSNSKGCAELISSSYRNSYFNNNDVGVATARAGNVIGGGDWAKDRIIPDAMRAFYSNSALIVRNPLSIRPWQHVLEPLSGYLLLAQKLYCQPGVFSQGWNFGPSTDDAQPVSTLVDILSRHWGEGASWELDSGQNPHEAQYLKLDCSKAASILNWKPRWRLDKALLESVRWYKAWSQNTDMHDFTLQQINSYISETSNE